MKVYFLSSKPCILTLNGAYFGLTDTFERFAELSPKDNIFAQFTPEDGLPIKFFLNENIRFHPPERCEVYLLRDGLAIFARDFPSSDTLLKAITQEREGKTLVTVFRQGSVQISIEGPDGFFIAPLPPSFEECRLQFYQNFILVASPTQIALFSAKGQRLLLENATEFSLEKGTLVATLPLSDRLNRTAKCTWELTGEEIKQTAFTVNQQTRVHLPLGENAPYETVESQNIRDEILPYAFFESVLIGADYESFLCDELKPKADGLKEFLGEYESVVLTQTPNVCGLVRKKAERLFEVDEYRVEIANGKITDVKTN